MYILFLYLKLVYYTSKWEFIISPNLKKDYLNQIEGALFAIWHNRLAFGIRIIQEIENIYALASPHTDGRLVTDIIKQMGIKVISGSTNRNSAIALKEIINKINSGNNVIITPTKTINAKIIILRRISIIIFNLILSVKFFSLIDLVLK